MPIFMAWVSSSTVFEKSGEVQFGLHV